MSQKNFACYIVTKEYLADRNNIFSSFYLWIFLTGGPCPNGWYNFKNHCYLVSSSVKTWHQAQEYCRSQEGDLVKITSAEENDFVLDLVRKRTSRIQVWIGLQWNAYKAKFMWTDYSLPVYTNWAPYEPNGKATEPCSNMWIKVKGRPAGSWNDLPCGILPNFRCGIVCKKLRSI